MPDRSRTQPRCRDLFPAAAALLLVLLLQVAIPVAAADVPLARRAEQALREGRYAAARDLCREFNARHPGRPQMLYNQACAENRLGDRSAALASFAAAVRAGFDDVLYAADDPDLAGLAGEPAFEALVLEVEERLETEAAARQLVLIPQEWSAPQPLAAASGDTVPSVRWRWNPAGLDVEITGDGPWAALAVAGGRPPWEAGAGAVVTVAIPGDGPDYASDNHFVFAFGHDGRQLVGAAYLERQGLWQRVQELAPKLREDPQAVRQVLTARIPWQLLIPYHPLVDPVLGLNVAVRVADGDRFRTAAWFADRAAFVPSLRWRRIVPVRFAIERLAGDFLFGRVSRAVVRDAPVDIAVTALATTAGDADLRIEFLDRQGRPLPGGEDRHETMALRTGPNLLRRQADMSGLDDGAYLLKVSLTFPTGNAATWSTTLLRLAPDWTATARTQVDLLPADEQATVLAYIEAVEETLDRSGPRRSPGAMATTIERVNRMLANHDATGTILPPRGSGQLVYPGPDGADRQCLLLLAEHWQDSPVLPVVILQPDGGSAVRILDRIERFLDVGDRPEGSRDPGRPRAAFVLPLLPTASGDTRAAALDEAAACVKWARAYFGADGVLLAGIDAGGGTALKLTRIRPAAVTAAALLTGRRFLPWPDAPESWLRTKLAPVAEGPPLTWIDFPQESAAGGQAGIVLPIMQDLGYPLADVQTVRGGLSWSQAADRIALWAAGFVGW